MNCPLITAFRAKQDEATFQALFDATKALVYTVCRRVLRNNEDAEEAFQETYIRLFRIVSGQDAASKAALPQADDASLLLGRIAYLEADRLRHKRARRQSREVLVGGYDQQPSVHSSIREQVLSAELRGIIVKAIGELPEQYRLPLELHYLNGLTYADITAILGLPAGTVASQIRRGTERLEAPLRKVGITNAGATLSLLLAGAQLLTPSSGFSASVVFSAARAAAVQSAIGNGANAGLSGLFTAKFMTGAAAAIVGVALVTGTVYFWSQGVDREAAPVLPNVEAAFRAGGGGLIADHVVNSPEGSEAQGEQVDSASGATLLAAGESSDPPTTATVVAESSGGSLQGKVYDPAGLGLAGIHVRLRTRDRTQSASRAAMTTETGSDGGYTFEKLPPGDLLVETRLDNASHLVAPAPLHLNLNEGQELSGVDFRLQQGVSIVGTVDTDTSPALEGAVVTAELLAPRGQVCAVTHDPQVAERHYKGCPHWPDETEVLMRKTAITDADGHFELRGIHPESRVMSVQATANECLPESYQPLLPFTEKQRITLKTSTGVLLVVHDSLINRPVERFRYRVLSTRGHTITSWTVPGADEKPGEAHIHGIVPGDWSFEVEELESGGRETGRKANLVYFVSGRNDIVRLSFDARNDIYGVVLDPSGQRLAGAQIRIYPYLGGWGSHQADSVLKQLVRTLRSSSDSSILGSVTTHSDGTFEAGGFAPGKYELIAEHGELLSSERVWANVTASDESEPVLIRMAEPCGIYGAINNIDGTPFDSALVTTFAEKSYPAGARPQATADANGQYVMRNLWPDYYKVGIPGHPEKFVELTLKPGEWREVNIDLSGRVTLSGMIRGNGSNQPRLYLREKQKGYPFIWDGDTGYRLMKSPQDDYTVTLPAGDYYLWATSQDNRTLIVDEANVEPSPQEQTRHFDVGLADVSVVVIDPDSRYYDQGVVCFDQRHGTFVQPRVFSMALRDRQSFFSDMIPGEYRVSFTSNDNQFQGQSDWVEVGPGKDNAIVLHAKPSKTGSVIGSWDPTTISTVYKDHDFEANEVVKEAGSYQVTVLYNWGNHGVRVQWVSLRENGVEVSRDTHEGWSGTGKRDHIYTLQLPRYNQQASYSVHVHMCSESGTRSQGTIYMTGIE